jgi:hypothetical protein
MLDGGVGRPVAGDELGGGGQRGSRGQLAAHDEVAQVRGDLLVPGPGVTCAGQIRLLETSSAWSWSQLVTQAAAVGHHRQLLARVAGEDPRLLQCGGGLL